MFLLSQIIIFNTLAADDRGSKDHPLISRYPGQEIKWYSVENFAPYQLPAGPITAYRQINKSIQTQGRVTRIFYAYQGNEKTYQEIWINYSKALQTAGFKILAQGIPTARADKNKVGGRGWLSYALTLNPWNSDDTDIGTMTHGSATQGGSAAIVAIKQRAAGTVYVAIYIEKDSKDLIGTLVDIIEVGEAESGLVIVDAEAIGADINEYGRVVLDGIIFEFDQAILKAESNSAILAIVDFLNNHPQKQFYVVGHTDAKGSYAYNKKLSSDRAMAVVNELTQVYQIQSSRILPYGVGPLVPIFSNDTDNGREKNRRVELVEQ